MTRLSALAFLAIPVLFAALHALGSAQGAGPGKTAYADIDAARWKDTYPHEYTTWLNSATKWDEKVGKPLTMAHAVSSGQRIGAACVSCHSTAFVNLYAEYGGEVVYLDEATLVAESSGSAGVSCYSCHGDRPGEIYVSKPYILEAAAAGGIDTNDPNLVCAQCHALPNRAYEEALGAFAEDRSLGAMGDPDANTWSTLSAGTDAEDVYAWFVAHGEKNPRVIPGEMAYQQYHGSAMDNAGVTCAACHMEKATDADGTRYTRHAWQSPHANPAIYDNCGTCHEAKPGEMQKHVLEVQAAYQLRLSDVTVALNAARAAIENSIADEETLAQATDLWFEARFYSCYGQDSSEGIHGLNNPNTDYCFERCLVLCEQIKEMVR